MWYASSKRILWWVENAFYKKHLASLPSAFFVLPFFWQPPRCRQCAVAQRMLRDSQESSWLKIRRHGRSNVVWEIVCVQESHRNQFGMKPDLCGVFCWHNYHIFWIWLFMFCWLLFVSACFLRNLVIGGGQDWKKIRACHSTLCSCEPRHSLWPTEGRRTSFKPWMLLDEW